MPALRRAKREAALLVALADIGGIWDVVAATEALTRFADAAVRAALAFLLRKHARAGLLALDADAADIESGSGLVVLALGKHGARELNYSSDIDLIVLFDPAAASIPRRNRAGAVVRAPDQGAGAPAAGADGRRLCAAGSICGYGPIRPRPRSRSRPSSAYQYYETVGQNWERAALIKARPAAGDLKLGERFLADLAPFIWRKYFDYAAIADIHAMKRQIHAVRGHEHVVVPGHDVKLGRGGIREIEFFVQTQQLIFGGRRPQMRGSRTLDMLQQLCADKWISAEAVDDLTRAYAYLASRRTSAADGRRRADAAPSLRARGADALRQVLRLCAARGLCRRPHPSPDAGRAALRAAVRGRAGAQRRLGQSCLHRRHRRSGDARDLAARLAFSVRKPQRRPFAAGTLADARRSAAPARGRC